MVVSTGTVAVFAFFSGPQAGSNAKLKTKRRPIRQASRDRCGRIAGSNGGVWRLYIGLTERFHIYVLPDTLYNIRICFQVVLKRSFCFELQDEH